MKANLPAKPFTIRSASKSVSKLCFSASMLLLPLSYQSYGKMPAPDAGDGRGLFVRLEVPWTTLMQNESLQFEYVLKNASDQTVPVAIPPGVPELGVGFGWPAGGQPFLEGHYSPGMNLRDLCPLDSPLVVQNAQWPPLDGYGHEMQAWLELPAGQQIVWNQKHLPDQYFGVRSLLPLKGLQAHWLAGPGRWISSDVVPVKVVDVPVSERKEAFKAEWLDYSHGTHDRSATAYVIPIEGRLFLFIKSFRVTEVTASDSFDYQMDKIGTNMEIAITGPSGIRKVYYHVRHGFSRDIPWPIGPVSVFNPKPEPIPPAELESLRISQFVSAKEPGTRLENANTNRLPPLSSSESRSESMPNNQPHLWLLVGGTALLTGLSILILRVCRKRQRRKT